MEIRKVDADERELIEDYLSLDESLLYSLIPPYIEEGVLYTLPGQIDSGKKTFQELIPRLQKKICQEWELCKKIDDPVLNDQINLVVAIGDVICALVGIIPPNLIATLIVKMGVRAFCSCSRLE
ncbi:hypothetical protein KSF_110800 [Reticulibacter mediterranei]|uniref:Uncharacterized protein n=1 Tax=Reticulibacter mediterranei TaxID=2778369 RepID=A0A8J3N736_9CHLR|nr:hypothetical protein [Reticulibacter mediterranei]GHP01033.1 hypothetical protein KSF_110800 [Reticulibacter mediterranei]